MGEYTGAPVSDVLLGEKIAGLTLHRHSFAFVIGKPFQSNDVQTTLKAKIAFDRTGV